MTNTVERLGIRDDRFIDHFGRHLILRGINMVCKGIKNRNYIGKLGR